MEPSKAIAALVGVVTAVSTVAVVLGLLTGNAFLAVGVGSLVGLATGLSVWAIPRINRLLGEETGSLELAATAGGVAGAVAVLFVFPPLVIEGPSLGVKITLAAHSFTAALVGFGGAIALVVVRLSVADAEVRVASGVGGDE